MNWSIVEQALSWTGVAFRNYRFSKVSKGILVHLFAIQRKQFEGRNHPEPQLQTFQIQKNTNLEEKI